MNAIVPKEHEAEIAAAKNGWRRRRVGEIMADGDFKVIDDWGTIKPVKDLAGHKVLGSRDAFNDIIFTPRKRAESKLKEANK